MKVLVSGSSGFIGRSLVKALEQRGDQVTRLVRGAATGDELLWDPARDLLDRSAIEGFDAVVNLAGVGIGDRRWTAARKAAILESRVRATSLLSRTAGGLQHKPRVLVSASAIGIYGERGDEVLTEKSPAGEGFTAKVAKAWEHSTSAAEEGGIRVVHVRTAVVLGKSGGALSRQLPLFRAGLGAKLGSGKQWFSWITLEDEISVILRLLDDDAISGPVNASSPAPVTNAAFTRALGVALHRPALLTVPSVVLRSALGRQLADELLLVSQRVMPERLMSAGFGFAHPDIEDALGSVLGAG